MRRGGYAVYKGKEYGKNRLGNGIYHLFTKDPESLALGFTCHDTEKEIKKYGATYEKDVPTSEIERVYHIELNAVYKGIKCGVMGGSTEHGYDIVITASDLIEKNLPEDMAYRWGFEDFDRAYLKKNVMENEFDEIYEVIKEYDVEDF